MATLPLKGGYLQACAIRLRVFYLTETIRWRWNKYVAAILTYFDALSHHVPGGTGKKISWTTVRINTADRTRHLSTTKQGYQELDWYSRLWNPSDCLYSKFRKSLASTRNPPSAKCSTLCRRLQRSLWTSTRHRKLNHFLRGVWDTHWKCWWMREGFLLQVCHVKFNEHALIKRRTWSHHATRKSRQIRRAKRVLLCIQRDHTVGLQNWRPTSVSDQCAWVSEWIHALRASESTVPLDSMQHALRVCKILALLKTNFYFKT